MNYLDETNVIIRFRFTSDVYVEEEGMFIDDLEVKVSGVGLDDEITSPFKTNLRFTPNPSQFSTTLNYWIETGGMIKITLTDSRGTVVKTLADNWKDKGNYQLEVDINDLPGGVYYGILESQGTKISRKLVITR